jgi:nucleotide-binding universal stress UspA family protein
MQLIGKILYPVNFSPSCIAMAPYVKRGAALYDAKVSLIHVVDPASFNSFALVSRPISEISEELLEIGQTRLSSFLRKEFPDECERIVVSGDAAKEIARVAREGRFDLVSMPTHAGYFRQMLIGSTTAKVLNDADCPVLTSQHAATIAPRSLEHREWLCAVGLGADSERVLRFATEAAKETHSRLSIVHAVQTGDPSVPIQLDLKEQIRSAEREHAKSRIAELQRIVGCDVPVRISIGPIKEALVEAARETDADALIIGRGSAHGSRGRMRDLTYVMIRDSPFPVLSV